MARLGAFRLSVGTSLQRDQPLSGARPVGARVVADGKFLRAGNERFLVKGVSYGTFAPDPQGHQFPSASRVAEDFHRMVELGINTVRVYTPPPMELLDEAARHGLRVIVGLPWQQHTAFLDDRGLARTIRRELVAQVRSLASHPAALLFALGNEIPAGVVRWHGRRRVERFVRSLFTDAKSAAPEALFTYVNFPPTEFLDLSFLDVCAFNVYLHREPELRAYLARLQNVAGHRPLLLAEAGADSRRAGEQEQARITAMHVQAAFEEGACGAVVFAWTDEWWRGGQPVDDWAFGLVDRERRPKPAANAVAVAFRDAPFPAKVRASWPRVSVVVCAYDAASTLEDCLDSLECLDYPDYEIILVNDGSRDRTSEIGRRSVRVRVVDTPNRGLGVARNVGLAAATGPIVAYVDADVRVDRDWLTFLIQPLLAADDVVGSGGPNLVPEDDPPLAQCIARAPGGPTHVLLDDRVAEHVPGCNMAFRRDALLDIGGFNPIYLRAGDDVDVCWRLQARGWRVGFAPAALVWHHHRRSIRGFWRQQVGYGEGETWLMTQHPEKFSDGRTLWRGRIYSPLPFVRSLSTTRVNAGVWGTSAFPSVYRVDAHPLGFLPHSVPWQAASLGLVLAGSAAAAVGAGPLATSLLIGTGLAGLASSLVRNVIYALRSELAPAGGSRLAQRAVITFLHFVQPIARSWGRLRGVLTPPEVARSHREAVEPRASRSSGAHRTWLADRWSTARLLSGGAVEDLYWSERWTSAEHVLARLVAEIRRTRAGRVVAIDEGWSEDRDVSVLAARWAWLDLRVLVEEHELGRTLVRVGRSVRPTTFGVAAALVLGIVSACALALGVALEAPLPGGIAALLAASTATLAFSRTVRTAVTVQRSLEDVVGAEGMTRLPSAPRKDALAPSPLRLLGLPTAAALVIMILWLGAGGLLIRGLSEVVGAQEATAEERVPSVRVEAPNATPEGP